MRVRDLDKSITQFYQESYKVSRVCVASVLIETWVLKMDGMIVLSIIDRMSNANTSVKHYNPSLCSLVAALADSKVADRDIIHLDGCGCLVVVLVVILATG